MKEIELNKQFKKALNLMENSGKNMFITGKAGTGKSTLLEYFRSITRKNIVVLAPTGVASVNVRGETIHSFFGFRPDITPDKVKKVRNKKKYAETDTIVIDEISMVRADLFDCMDKFLRLNRGKKNRSFGEVQLILIGDLYQLPPVVAAREKMLFEKRYEGPYFFAADAFKKPDMEFIELEKVYRQKDEKFIGLLNAIRNNSIDSRQLAAINKRTGAALTEGDKNGFSVYLTTVNKKAEEINNKELLKLKRKIRVYTATAEGEVEKNKYPAATELRLAAGAQVMFLNNDSSGRWVNGTVGRIKRIKKDREQEKDIIIVEIPGTGTVEVGVFVWEVFHFTFNEDNQKIETETVGKFIQYPLRPAWAVTIHKSQGKTFDRVIIDIGKGTFAHGQTYVALSRCTSLEGISLVSPLKKSHIMMDWRIVRFLTGFQYGLSEKNMPFERKAAIIREAIKNRTALKITYLKTNDEKSIRVIKPFDIGEREYMGKRFIGVDAFCAVRKEKRVFRVDRILEIEK